MSGTANSRFRRPTRPTRWCRPESRTRSGTDPADRADTGAEVALDYRGPVPAGPTVVRMDFRDETRVGQHTYGISAKTVPPEDDQPATVAVEFTGADADGRIVAEGNLLVALEALGDSGGFLLRTLHGLAALHGQRIPGRTTNRSRSRAPNAGQPWLEEQSEQLRDRWMASAATVSGSELLGTLADEFGRTRSAVRAQLARIGCDPDVPGRALADPQEVVSGES